MNNEHEYLERRVLLNKLYDHYMPLLTEKQREVYELHEFSDLSLKEIAELYGKSRQAVYDLLFRTRSKLETLEKKMGLVTREEKENV
jgi:RNA polymerase sigma factor (sigma-70 family)